jgi:signal transduction histidine kinase
MRRTALAYLLLAALAGAASFLVARPAGAVLAMLTGASGVAALLAGIRIHRPAAAAPWALIGAALAIFVAADALFDVIEPEGASWLDLLWLAGYLPLGAGLLGLCKRMGQRARRGTAVDALIVCGATLLLLWELIARPVLADSHVGALDGWVNAAYLGLDVALLGVLVRFIVVREWMVAAFWLLALGTVALLAADIAYLLALETYEPGAPIDALWLACYVSCGAAALHPSMKRLSRRAEVVHEARAHRHRFALLGGALLVSPLLLGTQLALDRGFSPVLALICLAATTTSVARVLGVLRNLEKLRAREAEALDEVAAAHAQLAAQHEELRQLDQLKDEMVGSVSHEFRTPLTSIHGHAGLIAVTGELAPQQQRSLDVISRNTKRLTALVDDLLIVAKLQSGGLTVYPRDTDLARLVGEAMEAIRPAAMAKEIELTIDSPDELPLQAESARIAEILDNLLSNAVKYTDAGGAVRVRVFALAGGDTLGVEVRDSGIGVPAEELDRLFDRFHRTSTAVERHIQGTGLGLHISQGLAKAHGGRIAVESTLGVGSAFTLVLPARAQVAPPADEPLLRSTMTT